MSFTALSLHSLVFSLLHVVCGWTPPAHMSNQLLYSSVQWLLFVTFFCFLFFFWLKFSLCLPILLPSEVSILLPLLRTLYQVNYLPLSHQGFFTKVLSYSFVSNIFLFPHFTWFSVLLRIRWNSHPFQSWMTNLLQEMNLIVQPCLSSWLPLKPWWLSKQHILY